MRIRTSDLKIDWGWVKGELSEKERIPALAKNSSKHIIHIYLDKCLKEVQSLARPKITAITKNVVNVNTNSVILDGNIKFSGDRISSYIKGATDVELFLVTLGKAIEEKATYWMAKGEPLYGYLLDRIGSSAIESIAESAEEYIRKYYAKRDKSVSMRLSPGYCDWPIEEQFLLSKILNFSKIGVSLTDNCMMVPKKSISAMVAIGPKSLFLKTKSQCATCDKKDCDHRRV